MKVIKGSFADKKGISYTLNPISIKLQNIGEEWTWVIKDPAKYTRGRIS